MQHYWICLFVQSQLWHYYFLKLSPMSTSYLFWQFLGYNSHLNKKIILYDFILCRWQTHPSMPTITLIVKLTGLFYGTQSQSELCVEGLCSFFICVRFKGQGNRKWLSGLWRGWAQPRPGSMTVWHMALGTKCLMKHIQHGVILGAAASKCLHVHLCVHK